MEDGDHDGEMVKFSSMPSVVSGLEIGCAAGIARVSYLGFGEDDRVSMRAPVPTLTTLVDGG